MENSRWSSLDGLLLYVGILRMDHVRWMDPGIRRCFTSMFRVSSLVLHGFRKQ